MTNSKPTSRKFRVAVLTNLFASVTMGFMAYVAIKYGQVPPDDVKAIITILAERYAYMVGIVSVGFFGISTYSKLKGGSNGQANQGTDSQVTS